MYQPNLDFLTAMETSQDYIKNWDCAGVNHSLPDVLHIPCCVHGYLRICLHKISSQGKKNIFI